MDLNSIAFSDMLLPIPEQNTEDLRYRGAPHQSVAAEVPARGNLMQNLRQPQR